MKTDDDGNLTMSEHEFETRCTQEWLRGKTAGLDDAIAWLDAKAGEYYGKRMDDTARSYRDVATVLKDQVLSDLKKSQTDHLARHVARYEQKR